MHTHLDALAEPDWRLLKAHAMRMNVSAPVYAWLVLLYQRDVTLIKFGRQCRDKTSTRLGPAAVT